MSQSSVVSLPVSEALQTAWAKVSGFKGTFWGAFLLILFIMFCIGIIDGISQVLIPRIEPVFGLIGQIINYILQMGILYLGIRRAFDMSSTFKNVFDVFQNNKAIKVIGLYILQLLIILACMIVVGIGVGIAFTVGIIKMMVNQPPVFDFSNPGMVAVCAAFFIAGICLITYIAVRMWLAPGFILDRSYGPVQALCASFRATRCNFWRIFWYGLVQAFFLMLSIIPIGIGLIWSLPWVVNCYGIAYKKLVVNADILNQAPVVITTEPAK